MRTVFIAALGLGAVAFAQGQSAPSRESSVLTATATMIQQEDGTVRMSNVRLTFGGATLTADDAIWDKTTNEIQFRRNARLKLERVKLQAAPAR